MIIKKCDRTLIIRLDKGDEIISSVLSAAEQYHVKAATYTGLGATDCAEIGLLDLDIGKYRTQTFTGPMEITNITGNISLSNGKPYTHAHITVATRDLHAFGGHLQRAMISVTGEIYMQIVDTEVTRRYNDALTILEMQL